MTMKTCTVVIPNYSCTLIINTDRNNGVWSMVYPVSIHLFGLAGKCSGSASCSDYMTPCPLGIFSVKFI